MSARETIDRLNKRIDQQRQKIERMEKGKHSQDKRESRLAARVAELQQQVADLEAANDRLVSELLEARAAARPLLTDNEDDAGTQAMAELEMRGTVS